MIRRRLAGLIAVALLMSATAKAQQRDTIRSANVLPLDVAREAVSLFNGTLALRAVERLNIPAERTVSGNMAILNGPLTLAGRVTGRVLAINSDVILVAGARIDGDLVVVGGEVEGIETARIGGEIRIYHASLRYTQRGDELTADEQTATEDQWWRLWERRGQRNFNRLDLASAGAYNRVEGLPIRIGPVLYRDQGWGHLRFDATAIVRSEGSFSSSAADVGHDVRSEIRAGREYGATLGAQLFERVDAVESWQLSDPEAGLATFLFHRDYRDYYGRHGGRIHAALRATDNADLTLSYSDERWSSRNARNPLALNTEGISWRPNPQVDDGRFHVANLTLRVDTRNDDYNPFAGWYVLADYERGTGSVEVAGASNSGVRVVPLVPTRYQRGFIDIRRYNRLGPSAALNLRVVVGGWLSGDPLPLERRLSIDGPGTVPGFDFRVAGGTDVGTCATGPSLPGKPAQCERISLAQLEYRSDIKLSRTVGRPGNRQTRFRAEGEWVFFANAGRGWTVNAPGSPLNFGRRQFPPLSSYRTDIGGGLDFEHFGVYLAKALSEPNEPLNVLFRIRHRF